MARKKSNKSLRKVYVVGGSTGCSRFIENCNLVDKIEDADIVLFTGGGDINPSIYNKKPHPSTHIYPGYRDEYEKREWEKIKPGQLAVGICRGHQLLAALNGAILVQDVRNHNSGCTHAITNGKMEYQISSIHHQMVYPFDMPEEDYEVLYWSSIGSNWEGDGIDPNKIMACGEPEIMVIHKEGNPTCLGIQGHPEMMPEGAPVNDMINKLIEDLLCK